MMRTTTCSLPPFTLKPAYMAGLFLLAKCWAEDRFIVPFTTLCMTQHKSRRKLTHAPYINDTRIVFIDT